VSSPIDGERGGNLLMESKCRELLTESSNPVCFLKGIGEERDAQRGPQAESIRALSLACEHLSRPVVYHRNCLI
jgi:hypothetical protein